MKDEVRLQIHGTRPRWVITRTAVFLGIMVLYSLTFGIKKDEPTMSDFIIKFLFICGVTVYGILKNRGKRRDKHSLQIAAEVTEQFPRAHADELHSAYDQLRRKEMRFEALQYLCLAALCALWLYALYWADANPVSWILGRSVLLPLLLLTALGLLAASRFPRERQREIPLLTAHAADPVRQQIMAERLDRPDHREECSFFHLQEYTLDPMAAEDAVRDIFLEELKKQMTFMDRGRLLLVFLIGLPCLLFLLGIYLCMLSGPSYFLIFTAVLLFGTVLLWFYLGCIGNVGFGLHKRAGLAHDWLDALQNRKDQIRREQVLSALPSAVYPDRMELCLSRSGTFLWTGTPAEREALEARPHREAMTLTAGDQVLPCVLLIDRSLDEDPDFEE